MQANHTEFAKMMLGKVIAAPGYTELSDETKMDLIGDVFRKTRDIGRAKTIQQIPDILAAIAKEQKVTSKLPTSRFASRANGFVRMPVCPRLPHDVSRRFRAIRHLEPGPKPSRLLTTWSGNTQRRGA